MPDFCPNCGSAVIEDCECALCDSDDVTVSGNGKPFIFAPRFDPDTDNVASCSGAGLLAKAPAYILNPPRCHVFHSANQSTNDDEVTVLSFNSERYDTDTMHSTVTEDERVTFTTAGIYIVVLHVTFAGAAAGDRQISIHRNGIQKIGHLARHVGAISRNVGMPLCIQDSFEAGDFINARAKQDSGGALNVLATRSSPILAVQFIRPLPTT